MVAIHCDEKLWKKSVLLSNAPRESMIPMEAEQSFFKV